MMRIADPLVSTIVLSYNQSRFVLETLESVKAQTYKAIQLTIVDDCSSDDSVATIDRWLHENRIDCTFICHKKNEGICKSLNDALAVSSAKYVSMVASDDVWLPDKIAQQVKIMESQPDHVGILYSDALQMDEHGHSLPDMFIGAHRKLREMPQGQILNTLLEGNFIPAMTTLIRRRCYDVVGLYDEQLPWEDWDMWLRLARHYSFLYSPTPSAKYRLHQNSYSHSDPDRMLKQSFRICLKQFGLGDLTEYQESKITQMLLYSSECLYSRNDAETPDNLLALWRASGSRKARWMYLFAKSGISFRNWQRANGLRKRLHSLRGIFAKSP
jgi:glycosyltransferase involved in cell wall biosynthesis